MYDDQDRPPWLRDLRPARPDEQIEPPPYRSAPTIAEPTYEPAESETVAESPEEGRGPITRQQLLLLAFLLWANVSILGCLCLLATGKVIP